MTKFIKFYALEIYTVLAMLFIVSTLLTLMMLVLALAGCKPSHLTEQQLFEVSVIKELPFPVDSISWLTISDIPAFRFSNVGYTDAAPDAEIRPDGDYWVCNMLDAKSISHQSEEVIWRNVRVSPRNQRVICIDRYLRHGRTVGYCYVLQSECKKYPVYGSFHWDVSDSRNIEMTGSLLEDLKGYALKRSHLNIDSIVPPTSQDEYWNMVFHADSLFDAHLYDEAQQVYDIAFSEDRFILPSQLSTTANKLAANGGYQKALAYLRHRIAMEKDFYEDPSMNPYPELSDTFKMRSRAWHYDLLLKKQLESIFEHDQYDRMLWSQAVKLHPDDTERNEHLARRALMTDSLNLALIDDILSTHGFPGKELVGDFGSQAVWLVFQHAKLDYQKRFLPQLEDAVARGDIAPLFLALLRDRIEVREGRPQKYGTQTDAEGHLAPLLDASRVNEWRQEVGLPALEQFRK